MKRVALLGQPNAGKSTIFNELTGSHQHVGNWPGKTVEKKEGTFTHDNEEIIVADLPGSYSLSANSDEEIVTRDYIISGNADLVLIIIDASQLERSLYMLADYAGIRVPAVLVLNLMDVAGKSGMEIDSDKLSRQIGIPVIPFVAADKNSYPAFKDIIVQALKDKASVNESVFESGFLDMPVYQDIKDAVGSAADGSVSSMWYAVKMLENDAHAVSKIKQRLSEKEWQELERVLPEGKEAALNSGSVKFEAVHTLTEDVLKYNSERVKLSKFDRIATGRVGGKLLAFGVILLAFAVAMVIAAPIMGIATLIPTYLSAPIADFLNSVNVHPFLVSLVSVVFTNVLFFVLAMSGFVIGVNFAFSIVEEVGYMARISFVFDNVMQRLGLQGKSMCAFFMGMGCTMGGVTGTRVLDNYGQRLLAMALIWSVPCGSTWSVIPTIAYVFYGGKGALLLTLALVAIMLISIMLVSAIFGRKLAPEEGRTGMVMELPPYHKPRWGHIVRTTVMKAGDVFKRAMSTVLLVSIIFYLFSYPWNGHDSFLVLIGQAVEPVTHFFGLRWQTFMAFISSMLAKESMLGVLGSLYTGGTDIMAIAFNAKSGVDFSVMDMLPQYISKAEALAFLFAVSFNMPCAMSLSTTYKENHSKKWTAIIALYYTVFALFLAFIAYHVGMVIFGA